MKTPKMPETKEVLPEVIDESKKTDAERDRLNRRRGRASTILAGGDYIASAGKSLLGE
jgi:hypothetical protein